MVYDLSLIHIFIALFVVSISGLALLQLIVIIIALFVVGFWYDEF